MSMKNAPAYAGLVDWRRNKQTGTQIGLYNGDEAGMDTCEGTEPWTTVCEEHHEVCAHDTRQRASEFMAVPAEWCSGCRAIIKAQEDAVTPEPKRVYDFTLGDPTSRELRDGPEAVLVTRRIGGSGCDVHRPTRADLVALRDQITAFLERGKIFYEVRSHSSADLNDPPAKLLARATTEPGEESAWEMACSVAEPASGGADIFRVVAGEREDYIVSYLGGSPHWWLPGTHGGGIHQIGSGGFCWSCFKDEDGKRPIGMGALVRHPVTPEEIGNPDHTAMQEPVRFGKEACKSCTGGYSFATADGVMEYRGHEKTCTKLHPVTEEPS